MLRYSDNLPFAGGFLVAFYLYERAYMEIDVQVGARLLQLFLETAVYRAPASECGDDVPEFRPAFKHTSRVYTGKGKKM